MTAKKYLENAIKEGINKPVYFRGFNHCWESILIPMNKAIQTLESDFKEYLNTEIKLSQSGVDTEFSDCFIVYFID